eukprot:scaffold101144_cov63-Phaeocystis_antarctica.AAC.7
MLKVVPTWQCRQDLGARASCTLAVPSHLGTAAPPWRPCLLHLGSAVPPWHSCPTLALAPPQGAPES